jgi:DNA-binding response OmpR family regulator
LSAAPTALSREAALQARVDELEFEVAELRAALSPPGWQPPRAWKLTRREGQVFALFLARELVTQALVSVQLWPEPDGGRSSNLLAVHVCKLRAKLAPFGVRLQLVGRGEGYTIPPAQRAALRGGAVRVTPEACDNEGGDT